VEQRARVDGCKIETWIRSHRAMRGAAPKAIQELVGHCTLTMTLRYMHLAPSALTEAIGLLNFGQPVGSAVSGSC
jgi:hypothetical protein